MGFQFETLGNATIQLFEDGRPILTTDPWLVGTAYFGSWSLDHALTPAQIANTQRSTYLWFSHGHPDHLHAESLELLSRKSIVLLPNHYSPGIADYLRGAGFEVRILRFKEWTPLQAGVRVLCLENENQDAMLVIEAGDALLINKNDSPAYGEEPFLRELVRQHPNSWLLSLCSIDADMLNYVDAQRRPTNEPPERLKPGAIWDLCDLCTALAVPNFCCSSSQHLYVRKDTVWANPYRISYADLKQHWNAPRTRLIEPFVSVDLSTGVITRNHASQEPDWSQITDRTGEDDWAERMSEDDWRALGERLAKYELLQKHIDFVRFTVGGESRTFHTSETTDRKLESTQRGVHFRVPRDSLMKTVRGGYFDDLLIGNFMETELVGTTLYPHFTPIVAKLGDNAGVYSEEQHQKFLRHYHALSPSAYRRFALQQGWRYRAKPFLRGVLRRVGALDLAKTLGRKAAGLPPLPNRD